MPYHNSSPFEFVAPPHILLIAMAFPSNARCCHARPAHCGRSIELACAWIADNAIFDTVQHIALHNAALVAASSLTGNRPPASGA